MSKNNKGKSFLQNKVIKFRILIISICLLIGFVSTMVILAVVESKSYSVAFFGIPDEYQNSIKNVISKSVDKNVKFSTLLEKKFDAEKISKKYDLFIGWDGNSVKMLEPSAKLISEECNSLIVSSLISRKHLPILLDHYEIAYNRKNHYLSYNGLGAQSDYLIPKDSVTDMGFPLNYDGFLQYLQRIQTFSFVPLCLEGIDDDTLLAFISSQIESVCGEEIYSKLISEILKNPDFDFVLETDLGYVQELQMNINLKSILIMITNLYKYKFLHPNWYKNTEKDIKTFAEQEEIGVLFTSLSKHRKIDEKIMRQFIVQKMPVQFENQNHGLIAPQLCAVKLSDKKDNDIILKALVAEENQVILSDETKLAPVNLRAMPYDAESNDVRYLAALSPKGSLPDLSNACFQLDSEKKHAFAEKIRQYVEILQGK